MRDRLIAMLEPKVAELGYELVELEHSSGLVRLYIDFRPAREAGITVDDCERVTRQLQFVLEVEACPYERLEVSSPGLSRPLRKASDYQRFSGHQVEITLREAFQGRKKYRGLLSSLDETQWRVVFNDGKVDQALDFQLEEVREARLVPEIDFKGRNAKPAASRSDSAESYIVATGFRGRSGG